MFRAFFKLVKLLGSKGWFYFGPRKQGKLFSFSSSIHGWKNWYFFVTSNEKWGFKTVWQEPNVSPNYESIVSGEDQKDFEVLLNMEVPPFEELLIEENLYYAEIASRIGEDLHIF